MQYRAGAAPLVWLTHNPGRGEPFQLRSAVDQAASPLRSTQSYEQNSMNLASWYVGDGGLQISASARDRVCDMLRLSENLRADGVVQVELFPLHSEKRPPDEYLFGSSNLPDDFARYRTALSALLANANIVVGLSGAPPDQQSPAVQAWQRALGQPIGSSHFVDLSGERTPPTVGAFVHATPQTLRLLLCRQGSNGLPAEHRMPPLLGAIARLQKP